MYSLLIDPDGSIDFALHRAPERLDAAGAVEALDLIEPVLERLRRRAGVRGPKRSRPESAEAASAA